MSRVEIDKATAELALANVQAIRDQVARRRCETVFESTLVLDRLHLFDAAILDLRAALAKSEQGTEGR